MPERIRCVCHFATSMAAWRRIGRNEHRRRKNLFAPCRLRNCRASAPACHVPYGRQAGAPALQLPRCMRGRSGVKAGLQLHRQRRRDVHGHAHSNVACGDHRTKHQLAGDRAADRVIQAGAGRSALAISADASHSLAHALHCFRLDLLRPMAKTMFRCLGRFRQGAKSQ